MGFITIIYYTENLKNMKNNKIEKSIQDPIIMKRIIDNILDPKNPDSNIIRKEVIKNIAKCIQKDTTFLTTLKGIIIEKAELVTKEIVTQCIEEYREQLINALVTTINNQCQDYFLEQKKIVNKIIKKTLNETVTDILNSTKVITDKSAKKIENVQKKNMTNIQVPAEHFQEAMQYIQFLTSKK